MSMMREIYQQIIIDHSRNPRNFHELPEPCQNRVGHNRLCGDSLNLYIRVQDNIITECSFTGDGCAIALSSASLLTEIITGLTTEAVTDLFNDFHAALVNGENFDEKTNQHERLAVFLGVGEYPARVKCATLAWQTLMSLIQNSSENVVSTE